MENFYISPEMAAFSDALWDFDPSIKTEAPYLLYHYRSGASLQDMFTKDNIVLRLTNAIQFEDKTEGRIILDYYIEALTQLLQEKNISETQYKKLTQYTLPDTLFMPAKNTNGIPHYMDVKYDSYIICFSTKKDDPYMYQKYVHNKGTGSFCIELFSGELWDNTHLGIKNNCTIKSSPVFYGNQIIIHLKEELLRCIKTPVIYDNMDYFVPEVLQTLQFSAKEEQYAKESEYRLIVYLPHDEKSFTRPDIIIADDETYISLKIPKSSFHNITWYEDDNKEIVDRTLLYLQNQGYRIPSTGVFN